MNQITPALLNPASTLVTKFTSDGGLFVYRRDRQPDGTYLATSLGQIAAVTDVQPFEFGLGVPDAAAAAQGAALFVERFGGWTAGWDEENARILGGEAFPFGNDPVGVPATYRPGFPPPTKIYGRFSNPFGPGATLITEGLQRKLTVKILPNVRDKYLSLWLAAGQRGYVRFSAWPGGAKTFAV